MTVRLHHFFTPDERAHTPVNCLIGVRRSYLSRPILDNGRRAAAQKMTK